MHKAKWSAAVTILVLVLRGSRGPTNGVIEIAGSGVASVVCQ